MKHETYVLSRHFQCQCQIGRVVVFQKRSTVRVMLSSARIAETFTMKRENHSHCSLFARYAFVYVKSDVLQDNKSKMSFSFSPFFLSLCAQKVILFNLLPSFPPFFFNSDKLYFKQSCTNTRIQLQDKKNFDQLKNFSYLI